MRKNILKSIGFLLGLIVVLLLSSNVTVTYGLGFLQDPYTKMSDVTDAPANTYDYFFIGDSECSTSVTPIEIWQNFGYTGYNCGIPGQRLGDTYSWLKKCIKNQSPKYVFLETNALFREITYMKEIEDSVAFKMSDVFPIFRYHNDWLNIDITSLSENREDQVNDSNQPIIAGYKYNAKISPYTNGDYVTKTKAKAKLRDKPLLYLNKIMELCKERDIQLVFYSAPSPVCWNYSKHNAAEAFAKENNLEYLDFNTQINEIGIDWSKDTRDKGNHINYHGAKKLTTYIGNYLLKSNKLVDHRGDALYDSWNKDLETYLEAIKTK